MAGSSDPAGFGTEVVLGTAVVGVFVVMALASIHRPGLNSGWTESAAGRFDLGSE